MSCQNDLIDTPYGTFCKNRIALFGYGMTTKAIAEKLGGECIFYDDHCIERHTDEAGNVVLPSKRFDPNASDLEITTPSLPPNHPLIRKAKHLMSEYDFFLGSGEQEVKSDRSFKPFTIWISGTNGKTTTTQMLTHLLAARQAVSGGNIGTPLAKLPNDAPIWVLETSSFTLHHTHNASPDIYILLPITPDHLDWHGSMEAYIEAKLKPLRTMKEGQLALIPKSLTLPQTDAWVVRYDDNEALARFFEIDTTRIDFKGAFLQDALLALGVTKAMFDEIDYDRINAFCRDAHRQEEFVDTKGRLWVNDSKATNLDATIQAVRTYGDKSLHLILGGEDKGVDLSPLFELLRTLDACTVYAVGKNQTTLETLGETYNVKVVGCETIPNAVEAIDKTHTDRSVALLSPAAASLDQFTSYKERGDTFVKSVRSLIKL